MTAKPTSIPLKKNERVSETNKASTLTLKIDQALEQTLVQLAAKQHKTKSEVVRNLLQQGLEKELAKESIDYIRNQIHDEIMICCKPQFERIAKLIAKVGYQSVADFYLSAYIMDSILPEVKKVEFEDIKRNAKIMAISYLRLSEEEFADFWKSEDNALKILNLE